MSYGPVGGCAVERLDAPDLGSAAGDDATLCILGAAQGPKPGLLVAKRAWGSHICVKS